MADSRGKDLNNRDNTYSMVGNYAQFLVNRDNTIRMADIHGEDFIVETQIIA